MSKDLGKSTSYAYYVEEGGTKTPKEYGEMLVNIDTVATRAEDAADAAAESATGALNYKNAAQTAAQTATAKASEASTSATSASGSASVASASASAASESATQAAASATSASGSATAAAGSAITASTKASEAAQSEANTVIAKNAAEAAQTAAEAAQGKAEDAKGEAETTAQSIAASAAQIATNTADITKLKEDITSLENGKANTDGYYADLVSGGSTQLLSDMVETDTTPYNYRTAGGSLEIGDRMKLKEIVGLSLPVNQLVQNGDFADGVTLWSNYNCDATASNGIATVTPTNTVSRIYQTTDVILNHKYLMSAEFQGTSGEGAAMLSWYGGVNIFVPFSGSWQNVSLLLNNTFQTASKWQLHYGSSQNINNVSYQIRNAVCFDLTLMLGSTIADYVYTLESGTAGAGVAWLKKYFPKIFDSGYIPYNAGTLEHVSGLSAHKMTGFNQFDGTHNAGYWDVTDGSFVSGGTIWAGSDYIPCFPNTNYYWKFTYSGSKSFGAVLFYGANKNYLGYRNTGIRNSYFATPNDCYYMTFYTNVNWFNDDICINLHWDGERDGEYEPYEEHVYALPSDETYRGILKIDANGVPYADGDIKTPDGTIQRRIEVFEVTSCTSVSTASTGAKYASVSLPTGKNAIPELVANAFISNKYQYRTDAPSDGGKWFRINVATLFIFDSRFTDKETAIGILASEKPQFVYTLATPTTEEGTPYTEEQITNNWGTEELVSTTLVPVGHVTDYHPDLRAKLEVSPESPDTDGLYLMKRENGENSYVAYLGELPSDPTTDGTYTLKCTVASGAATKTWEADT